MRSATTVGDVVNVTVVGSGGRPDMTAVTSEVVAEGVGYEAIYTIRVAGSYRLHAYVNGAQIDDSPINRMWCSA